MFRTTEPIHTATPSGLEALAAGRAREDRRREDEHPERREHHGGPQDRLRRRRPPDVRHVPHGLHRVLRRPDAAEARPDRGGDPDRQGDARGLDPPEVLPDVLPDDRELRERRIEQPLLQRRIVAKDDRRAGHEDQQQREQREEAVVGHRRRQVPRAVLTEVLDHGQREGHGRMAPLEPVGTPNEAPRVHGPAVPEASAPQTTGRGPAGLAAQSAPRSARYRSANRWT